ncbi:MAG: hypothetical protein FWD52_04600 [Candidatus Bathyarchaeota archaeon]|nr:hypothetical protein [Candidatus Termiticorpusculum sp.]
MTKHLTLEAYEETLSHSADAFQDCTWCRGGKMELVPPGQREIFTDSQRNKLVQYAKCDKCENSYNIAPFPEWQTERKNDAKKYIKRSKLEVTELKEEFERKLEDLQTEYNAKIKDAEETVIYFQEVMTEAV